jgi:hypothetical protein
LKATLYYPNAKDADTRGRLFMGLRPEGVTYYKVWEGEAEGAGQVFEKFNVGDYGGIQCRSMSVGDIVEIDGKFLHCDIIGWSEVSPPEIVEPAKFGW